VVGCGLQCLKLFTVGIILERVAAVMMIIIMVVVMTMTVMIIQTKVCHN